MCISTTQQISQNDPRQTHLWGGQSFVQISWSKETKAIIKKMKGSLNKRVLILTLKGPDGDNDDEYEDDDDDGEDDIQG